MKKILLLLVLIASLAVQKLDAQTTATGKITVVTSTTLPLTCSGGDVSVTTDTFALYECGPTNVWTINGTPAGATWATLPGGTNTTSTFICGTGCSITTSGSGTITSSNGLNSVTNDTNVLGTLSGEALTLGWSGTLAVSRGGTGDATLTGIVKGNGTSQFTAAVNTDIIGLMTGSCSSSTWVRGDGSCQSISVTTPTFEVNGTNNSTQTFLNNITSTVNAVGLTVTPSNPTTGNVKFEITGAYTGNATTATTATNLAGAGTINGNFTGTANLNGSNTGFFGQIDGLFFLDGHLYTTLNAAFTACNVSPGCNLTIPPGVYPFSSQIAPTYPATITGSGDSESNASNSCATTLQWTGGATPPIALTGFAATGSNVGGFCLYTSSGSAPPVLVDVDNAANNVTVHDITVDYANTTGKVEPTVAAFRWGNTGIVVNDSARNLFVRNVPLAFDLLNISAVWNGFNVWGTGNTLDLQLGSSTANVESFSCYQCKWGGGDNTSGTVSVVANNVYGASFTDNEWECGSAAAAYCLDVPSTATLAEGIYVNGGTIFGENLGSSKLEYVFHLNLASSTMEIAGVTLAGIFNNPVYLIKNDNCLNVLVHGITFPSASSSNFTNTATCNATDIGSAYNSASTGLITAGTVAVNNAATVSFTGPVNLYQAPTAKGTPNLSGTGACSVLNLPAGGLDAGQVGCSGSTGASTLTITPGYTATHGFVCYVVDNTSHVVLGQSSSVPTSCTVSGTVTNSDTLLYGVLWSY